MTTSPPAAVFLSYASQDAEAAKRICEALRAAGVEVWFDQSELVGGDQWDQRIRKQIKDCALLIPIISANTQCRTEGYFRLEWRLADQRTHLMGKSKAFLLPVTIDGTTDADADVPDSFIAVQWTKAPGGEVPPAFAARVKKLLGGAVSGVADTGPGSPGPATGTSVAPASTSAKWLRPILASVAIVLAVLAVTLWQANRAPALSREIALSAVPISEARRLVAKAWQKLDSVPEPARAELDAANEYYQRAVALDPTDADVWALGSQIDTWYVAENVDNSAARRESARTKAAKALNLAPDSYEARLAQAVYLVRGEGFDTPSSFAAEAEKRLRELLREKADEPRTLLALGHLLRNSRRVDDASEQFDRLAQNPAWTAAATNAKAWMMYRVGRWDDAAEIVARSVAAWPFHGNVRLQGHLAMDWQGDLNLAKAALERMPAEELREDYGVYFAVLIYWYRREPQEMLRVLNAAPHEWVSSLSFIGPKDYWVGEAQQMAGNQEAARVAWQAGLRLVEQQLTANSGSAELHALKGQLLVRLGDRGAAEKALALAGQLEWRGWAAFELRDVEAVIAAQDRAAGISWAKLRFDPELDFLRGDPRFGAALAAAAKDPKRLPRARISDQAQGRPVEATPDAESAPAEPPAGSDSPRLGPKSIAVLPFDNMSEDKDSNAFFADGIHEDILTSLGNIRELRVVSRTSVLEYRGKTENIRDIARKLGVAYVLEGSVRRASGKVRVTGQLIRAATDEHVWAQDYTKDLTAADVFAIQSDLAQKIAASLQAVLSPQEKKLVDRRPTENLAAYDLYLKSRELHMREGTGRATLERRLPLLEAAVTLDPKFALGWADLAYVQSIFYWKFFDCRPARLAAAKAAIETAVKLAPDAPEVIRDLGSYYLFSARDYPRAREQFERADRLQPNGVAALELACILRQEGKWREAKVGFRRMVQLEPKNIDYAYQAIGGAAVSRHYDEYVTELRRISEFAPNNMAQDFPIAEAKFLASGSTREVERYFAALGADAANSADELGQRRDWAVECGNAAEAIRLDRLAPAQWLASELGIAAALASQGELSAARARLAKYPAQLRVRLEQEPENAQVWADLGCVEAMLGHREEALAAARKAVEILPVSRDALFGPDFAANLAFVQTWNGDKESAIAQWAELLQIPVNNFSVNVHVMRHSPLFAPLRGDPRWEALLADPKNNAPLF